MKKRDWCLVIGLVPAIWAIDQASKAWANATLSGLRFFGPFGLVLHHNPGAILGVFSDLPPLLRIVSLSTGGAFLVFIYAAIQYLLPTRSLPLRVGLSFLLGGILGNVTDRIVTGEVTDFLLIGSRSLWSPAFNFADAIQWVGYILVIYSVLREGKLFWPDLNARKRLWINPGFQWKYIFTLVGIGTCFAVLSGVFSYTFLKVTIDNLSGGQVSLAERRFLLPFVITYAFISMGFMLTLLVLGRILSHRIAGPIFAFETYLQDLTRGKDRRFRLRQSDDFKNLEMLAEVLRPLLLEKAKQDGVQVEPPLKQVP